MTFHTSKRRPYHHPDQPSTKQALSPAAKAAILAAYQRLGLGAPTWTR